MNTDYKDAAWLSQKHIIEGYSTRDMGAMLNVSYMTVRYWLVKHGILRRIGRDGNRSSRAIEKCRLSSSLRKHTPEEIEKCRKAKIGAKNPNWGGGAYCDHGYIYIKVRHHPSANSRGYVLRSRFVLEKKLGHYLDPKNIAHHINENKSDDRSENLFLCRDVGHHVSIHRKRKLI